ncbi:MAG: hypothetical protein ACRC28_06220 [Clostridium sp.]|uniref:hypothetical protein n=1 Tax=Clostridia TaxID=186801 RepID=UPI003F2BF5DE
MDIYASIPIIVGVVEQFFNDRLYLTYSIENAIYPLAIEGFKPISFKEYLSPYLKKSIPDNLKEDMERKNKQEIENKIKEQDSLLSNCL